MVFFCFFFFNKVQYIVLYLLIINVFFQKNENHPLNPFKPNKSSKFNGIKGTRNGYKSAKKWI